MTEGICHRCSQPKAPNDTTWCAYHREIKTAQNAKKLIRYDATGRQVEPPLAVFANARKLDVAKVRDIRQRLQNGETRVSLATLYGVRIETIRSIEVGKTWLHASA